MNQCTAVTLLPPPDYVARLGTPAHPMEAGYVLCELGEEHDGEHAQMLWDDDANDGAVWVRWSGRGERTGLACLRWCAVTGEGREACGLFLAHPAGHDWEVVDPTLEAVRRQLGLRHREPGPDA